MEFNEKLQNLRKKKGITQQELATQLYVSRTAISKWESGRGYPSIDSLKAIACFFSITVDELLSPDEVLTIAQENQKRTERHFKDLIFGLLDFCMCLLMFLPLFAMRNDAEISEASLLKLGEIPLYLKIAYFAVVIGTAIIGILTLALQNCTANVWIKSKEKLSFAFGVISTLLFVISLQTYAAVFAFFLLAIKVILLLKHN